MNDVPRLLTWAVTGLVLVLVGVAVAGSAAAGHAHQGAILGALFLTVYLGGAVYAASSHGNHQGGPRVGGHHREASVWLLVLTLIWAGFLVVSNSASWLAFPLILLQVGVWGMPAGAVAGILTALGVTASSIYRLPAGASPFGSILGPLIGALVGITFMWGILAVARESRARKEALDELRQTQTLLARAEKETIATRERQRLAGELHDTISQGLSATAMLLRAANSTRDSLGRDKLLEQALDATIANLREARRITVTLEPRELADARLPNALRQLTAEPVGGTLDVKVTVSEGKFDLPLAKEAALLRVAQSALWNVREHSNASRAEIRLGETPAGILLEVEDDGHGFQQKEGTEENRGVGLRAMRSRMNSIGGTFRVQSSTGGTTVTATVPDEHERSGRHESSDR